MITVIDLGISNIGSVLKALKTIAAPILLTSNPQDVQNAQKILLPGVGSFGAGMKSIREKGLLDPLRDAALVRKIPFLGICLGMQLLASKGHEHGAEAGLDIITGEAVPLDRKRCPVVPHMGWNNLETTVGNRLFEGLPPDPHFYFVHSFHLQNLAPSVQASYCTYGMPITAAIAWGNIFGMQFHPEKSQKNGLRVLKNFLNYA